MRFKQLLILTLLSISLFAQAQTIDDLSNKFWRLKVATISGMVYDFSNNISDAPTMQFSGGNIRGNGGCNAYHTKFTLNNNSIEFGNILSTRMACANLSLNEAVYFQALSQLHLVEYFPGRNELVFTNQSGDKLTYYSQFSRSENSISPPPPPSRNYNSNEENGKSRHSSSKHSRYKHGKKLSKKERLRIQREEREEARKNKKLRGKNGKKLSKKERLKLEKEERLQVKKDKKKKGKKGKRDSNADEKPSKKSKKAKKGKKETTKASKKVTKDKKGKDKKKK
jgi:heat shock protein HslJ